MELTITELAIRIRNDDTEAFNTIYWKYHSALYANIFKLTHNATATEDILQEVFIKFWEKRKTLDVSRPVIGWLFTVSYNMSVNYLKRKLKESLTYADLQQPVTVPDISEDKIELELSALKNAISQLSPQKRKVFELCKIDGKTYEEAAHELKISKYTVKEYLSGAVGFIKEHVQNQPSPKGLLRTRRVTYISLLFFISLFYS
jgi:RNA polymerase sigma-70 factor (ECF subfamily)